MATGRQFIIFATLAVFFGAASAAPPTIDAAFPAGGKIGTEIPVTFVGKAQPWPATFWASDSAVKFVPDEEKERVGKFVLDPKAKPGPVWFRFFNNEGTSEPRLFFVGNLSEISEHTEADHQSVSTGQKIKPAFPLVINGQLKVKNEADFFTVTLRKSQPVFLALDGYSLRSPIDPMLHIYDSDGARIELKHDGPTNLDPRLKFTPPKDGTYTIGVLAIGHPANANVYLQGSTACVYRLYIATDEKSLPSHFRPETQNVTFLDKSHTPNLTTFPAKKGDRLLAKVEAFSLGFATDPVLRILKPDGSLLRETDDVKPTLDAEYLWKVSADGDYKIEVADRFGRAGKDIGYRLTIEPPVPGFTAFADKHSYIVKAGETTDVKIKITRLHGHTEKLAIKPPKIEGIEFELPEIPDKSGDVTVKIKPKKEAKAFSGPIRFSISKGEKKTETIVPFTFQDTAARGPFLLDEIEDLWLTVTVEKPKEAEDKKKD